MAHFARLFDGKVVRVHVVANAVITDSEGIEHESIGQEFLSNLQGGEPSEYIQASYNGNLRYNYPAVGYTYDEERDAFIPPKPFESWVLDEDTCLWVAPIPYPEDGEAYTWNEKLQEWTAVENETE